MLVAVVLASLAAWQLHRGHSTAAGGFGAGAGVLLVCAAITPAAVWFYRYWMALAGALSFVNTRILLGLFFFVALAPIGFVLRLTGHDPLDRRKGIEQSYWRARPHTRQSREGYEQSF